MQRAVIGQKDVTRRTESCASEDRMGWTDCTEMMAASVCVFFHKFRRCGDGVVWSTLFWVDRILWDGHVMRLHSVDLYATSERKRQVDWA